MPRSILSVCFAISMAITLTVLSGCRSDSKPTDASTADDEREEDQPLDIVVVDDEMLAKVVQRQWRARSTAEVKVRSATTEEVLAAGATLDSDAIIYPAGLLGELVERNLVRQVPHRAFELPDVRRRDILNFDRRLMVSWGESVYAFSFGSPQLVLLYRKDIFDHLELSPPRTWEEYAEIAPQLGDRDAIGDFAPPEDQPWNATVEPLGEGWAGQMLLARAAAYARGHGHTSTLFNYETMEPRIEEVPFVRALAELSSIVAEKMKNENDVIESSPHDAREAIMAGRCAMAITWPTRESPEQADTPKVAISFAPIPGSFDYYEFGKRRWQRREEPLSVPLIAVTGRLGSVCGSARNKNGALKMLATLTSHELGSKVAPHSRETTIFRGSQLSRPDPWLHSTTDTENARAYSDTIRSIHESSLWLSSIRIPGRPRYLAALDTAVEQVTSGEATPREALKTAADRWREITDQLDVASQRIEYIKSLGMEP